MNDLNVIHLTSDRINYLNPNVLENFSNLNLISATGEFVKMNPLSLAAMHSDLTKFLKINEEEDVNIDQFNTIITEFSTEDLKQLVQFCHQGILPQPLTILEKSEPEEIPAIFTAFDIDLKKLLFSKENSKFNNAKIKKEKDLQLIKNEILEDFILDDIVQTLMETETKVVGKKRGRRKKNNKNNSNNDHDLTEDDYFDHLMENDQEISDHEPGDQPSAVAEIVSKPKTRRGRKKKSVSNDGDDEDWAPVI